MFDGERFLTKGVDEKIPWIVQLTICLRALEKMNILKKQRFDTFYSKRKLNGISAKVIVIKLEQEEFKKIGTLNNLNGFENIV